MPKIRKTPSLKNWLIPRLRRISMYWPEIKKARDRAKVYFPIGWHKNGNPIIKRYFVCQNPECGLLCGEEREGAVDHINPIVDVNDGFIDWNSYIPGLFCDESNLQFLCLLCHENKTNFESIKRKEFKRNV